MACATLFERLQTILDMEKSYSMLSWYSWDNIAQIKIVCNVAQEVLDNISQ